METIGIKLSREVYKSDAEKMADWLSDKEISSNLNEGVNAKENLINIINRIDMPILTHLFNNNCSFFTRRIVKLSATLSLFFVKCF
ncbi:MAG: hypothetical protein ACLSXJ_14435, partial [Clostridium saudiense]